MPLRWGRQGGPSRGGPPLPHFEPATQVEGNTRTGAHAAVLFLLINGVECAASPGALVDVTLATARGELSAEALAIWLRQRSRSIDR